MWNQADRRFRAIQAGAAMRPRRWYTVEVAPSHCRAVRLTLQHWRYQSLVRGRDIDAAPATRTAATGHAKLRRLVRARSAETA
jgi:hypothetical protein